MGEGKGSSLVHLLVIVLSLVAFGFAIAAERRRSTDQSFGNQIRTDYWLDKNLCYGLPVSSDILGCRYGVTWLVLLHGIISQGEVVLDEATNSTYCVYGSDVATGYGVGAFLFLLSGESLLMGVTKCMCFGRPLAPGTNRAWSIIYFGSSWLTFLVAESCLIAGATKNAYHTKYRGVIYAQSWTCESLRKGVFIAGAVFVVLTMILNVYYYMYFSKATNQTVRKTNRASGNVGMTGHV